MNQAEARADAEAEAEGAVEEALVTRSYPRTYAAMFELSNVTPHFDALENLLVNRALARQYPEGWGRSRE